MPSEEEVDAFLKEEFYKIGNETVNVYQKDVNDLLEACFNLADDIGFYSIGMVLHSIYGRLQERYKDKTTVEKVIE